jgi:hypothetical protein
VRETLRVLFDGPDTIFPFRELSKLSRTYFLMFILTVYRSGSFPPLKSGNGENNRLFSGHPFFRFSHFHISKTEAIGCCVEGLFSP